MSKDLERDVQVQSFGEGPDGGVDLLFEWEDNNVTKMYIWQCKRYETFNTLLAGLMKKDKNKPEWEKMHDLMNLHKIRPENFTYALVVSCKMLPQYCLRLTKLFGAPLLPNSDHIFGKERLNALLDDYPKVAHEVLCRYSPLTIEVMKTVISEVNNQQQWVYIGIQKKAVTITNEVFVRTATFNAAYQKLKRNGICVLLGIPGVGKTDLANMLGLQRVHDGFEIRIGSDIQNITWPENNGKKRLFIFDDPLNDFQGSAIKTFDLNSGLQQIQQTSGSPEGPTWNFLIVSRQHLYRTAEQIHRNWPRILNDNIVELATSDFTLAERDTLAKNHCSRLLPNVDTRCLIGNNKIRDHYNWSPRGLTEGITQIAQSQKVMSPEAMSNILVTYLNDIEGALKQEYSLLKNLDRIYLFSVQLAPSSVLNFCSKYAGKHLNHTLSEIDIGQLRVVHNATFVEHLEGGDPKFRNNSIAEFVRNQMRTSSCENKLWDLVETPEQLFNFEKVWPLSKDRFIQWWPQLAVTSSDEFRASRTQFILERLWKLLSPQELKEILNQAFCTCCFWSIKDVDDLQLYLQMASGLVGSATLIYQIWMNFDENLDIEDLLCSPTAWDVLEELISLSQEWQPPHTMQSHMDHMIDCFIENAKLASSKFTAKHQQIIEQARYHIGLGLYHESSESEDGNEINETNISGEN